MGGRNSKEFHPIGQRVVLTGLVKEPTLNNKGATVAVDTEADKNDGRVAMILNEDGRSLRVKPENLITSANQPVSGSDGSGSTKK
eukprot:11765803-Karenia_brevis.AAC.1